MLFRKAKAAKEAAEAAEMARHEEMLKELKGLKSFLEGAILNKDDGEIDYLAVAREKYQRVFSLQSKFPELVDALGYRQESPSEARYVWYDDEGYDYWWSYDKMLDHKQLIDRIKLWEKLSTEWEKSHPDVALRLEDLESGELLRSVGYECVAYLTFATAQKWLDLKLIQTIREILVAA